MSATPSSIRLIPGEALDYYLAHGYYRMHQDLFTCRFLPLHNALYTVHWLRLVVERAQAGPTQRRLWRLNERFDVQLRPFALTPELEALYARYRQAIDFDAPPTVEAFLLAGADYNVFATSVLEVRDAGRLIAAGIFDTGTRSLAGIMNFYDPEYRKFSLGKYLMLRKLAHARQQQLAYYYPGYVVHGYPKFDYKLFAAPTATEVFDARLQRWQPFSWEEVSRQAADLLADWADIDLVPDADE